MATFLASDRSRRLLGGAVGAVLAGNVVALFVLGDTGDDPVGRIMAPAEATATSEGEERTITLITTDSGRRIVADPSTPEGRELIRQSVEDGGTVETVPAHDTTTTRPTTSTTRPAAPAAGGGSSTLPTLPVTVPDPRSTVTTLVQEVEKIVDTVGGIVKDTTDDATDLVPGDTDDKVVDPVVDAVVDTVVDTVGDVGGTVDDTGDVIGTVDGSSTDDGSLLNGLVSQVEDTTDPVVDDTTQVLGGGLG